MQPSRRGLFDFMLSVGKCWLGLFLQGISDIYLLGLGVGVGVN